MPVSSYQQQKLRVCDVCSAYLGIHDNDRRLADHFGGKLHLGFIKIREKLAELEVKLILLLCIHIFCLIKNTNKLYILNRKTMKKDTKLDVNLMNKSVAKETIKEVTDLEVVIEVIVIDGLGKKKIVYATFYLRFT